MSKRTAFSLASTFSGATATVKQQEELKRLRNELEQLRAEKSEQTEEVLETLRQELKNYSGEQQIPLKSMRPSRQARQTFTKSAIRKRAESLKQHGQRTPIILVPVVGEEGSFKIEDGELRWRAASLLVEEGLAEWETLKAVIAPPPQDATELHKRSLVHNLHREDLNPLDRIEAIVEQIHSTVDLELLPEEIEECEGNEDQAAELKLRKIIRNLDYRFKKNPQDRAKLLELLEASRSQQLQALQEFELSEVQRQILGVFLELQLNINSVAANDLPMLTLPPDLKQAIRTHELPCRHALALAKLSADKLRCSEDKAIKSRQQMLAQVVSEALSLSKTRKLVTQFLQEQGIVERKRSKTLEVTEAKAALVQMPLTTLDEKELKSLQTVLARKLKEIEQLLEVWSK